MLYAIIRSFCSILILSISLFCVVIGIISDSNIVEWGGPSVEIFLLLLLCILLALNEGFQVGLIKAKGLTFTDLRAKKVQELIYHDINVNKMERLFIGQSFMVVFITFSIARLTAFANFSSINGVPDVILDVAMRSGLAGVMKYFFKQI